jgi:hypothetical protein
MKPPPRSSSLSPSSVPRASPSPRPRPTPRSSEAPTPPRRGVGPAATRSPSRSTSRRSGSCSISGATVTFVAVGTCVIDANQAGNASYEAATQVQQSFDPDSGTQTITFTSTPPSPAVVGGTYTPTASGGASGNPVIFSIDPSANGSCSISGATVTFVAVGTCVIDANQAGNANYEAATQVQQSFDPDPGTQTITFTSTPPSPAVIGGTYTPTASGGASGNPVTFSIDPSADGSCSISGATVTFVAVGTCVIDANQAGNANYEAATQVQQSFDPDPVAQTIAFTSTPPNPAVVGGTYPVTASGGASGNPVTFSIDPSAKGAAASRVPPSPSSPSGPASSTPTRPATPATRPPPRSSSPSPSSAPNHHLHLDPAQAGGRGRHLHGDGERWGQWQPGHLLDRPLGEWELQHLGCHRHLRRRRDLRHRRQPGRQRQLRGRHPGPAVLRRHRYPDHHLHLDPAQPGGRGRHLHGDGERWGQRQPGHLLDRPLGGGQLQHLWVPPSPSSPSGPASSTPTRPATPTMNPPPRSSSPSPSSAPRSSPSPRPRPTSAVVGGTYVATASGGASGNPVTFSIDPSANGSCSISGATVTFVAVGTCVIDANQAGNANYEAATQVQQSFAVVASGSPTFSPDSSQSATVASYTNGVAGRTDATITFTGPVPSSWVAASGLVAGSAVVDTTNTTVIADQSGGPGEPLGPTIASISGNTISLEQMVLNSSAAITGFTPAATTMTSANIGDVIRAATCTAYGANDGCPTYSMTAGSAGMKDVGNLTWDNPAYFVGQDASPSGIPSLSGYGGVGGGGSVTLAANSTSDATWTADLEGGQYNGVSAFSNEGTFAYSGIVDDYTSLTQTYAQHMPCCVLSKEAGIYGSNSNFWGWEMTEDYFTQPGGGQGQDQEELSIQNSYGSSGTVGTVNQNSGGSFTAATGTSGTDTLTTTGDLNNVTTGSLVEDTTHPSSIPSDTTVSDVTSSTGISLSATLSADIAGDTIKIANGWNYGVVANDIEVGTAAPTPSTTSGTSGGSTLNVATADFANPSTDMGLVTQDDPISDSQGDIPANTVVTSINQLTGAIGLSNNLTGTVGSSDTVTINLLWFLQDGAANHNTNGTCSTVYPNCGQLVLHAGCDWSDVADVPNPTGTIPTKGIVSWLETHAAPQSSGLAPKATWGNAPDPCTNPESGSNGQASGPWFTGSTSIVQDPVVGSGSATGPWADYGYIVPGSSVSELGQGWEILGTNSTPQTYSLSQFTIDATGGKASS